MNCTECSFCEQVIKAGDTFTSLDPFGMEVNKSHSEDIFICRAYPPITGNWPQVSEDDWCGKFKEREVV